MVPNHVNWPTNHGWEDVLSAKRYDYPEVGCYTIERWRDDRLCKQPLNCLAKEVVENKLRGGKNV